jgi:tetratricopeptide (TPR) repeat protein
LRRSCVFSVSKTSNYLLSALIIFIAGCSLEKKSGLNRSLQNLTAHYNILFNANELLRLKQESYASSFPDAYTELLNVYPDTTTTHGSSPDKDMEAAVVKANTIINIKEQSHYIGDAYLILGKARYLEGNYFDAVEYFNYVIRSTGKLTPLTQEAQIWKSRALLYLNNLPQAKTAIDTAIQNIDPKKSITADVYATKLQYDINTGEYAEAEEDAKLAIQYSSVKRLKLRWIFILAQLQELNLKPADAFANYTRIVQSNASFEMAFNANLNRIRIQDNQNGVKQSKIERLRNLLKNIDNKDFNDQIYYQIAQQYYIASDIDNAIKNYKLSIRKSTKNQNQKGISYLRIADIDFKNKADYAGAKLYYDSTLMYLSPSYPGYQIIRKKSNNLQILTGMLQSIAHEDTLQMLASLDEKTRKIRINAMVARKVAQDKAAAAATAGSNDPYRSNNGGVNNNNRDTRSAQNGQSTGNVFYFYNNTAVSQGSTDFTKQWGNRKLEDDWRRSKRSNSGIPASTGLLGQNTNDPDAPAGQGHNNGYATDSAGYRKELSTDLPLTPTLLAQSNSRVYNTYLDLGNFYRDVLGDKKEAIATFELLLARFPDNHDQPAIYYNLYRLYADADAAKSEKYKNLILKEYPETAFAKVILDPEYSKKLSDVNAEFNVFYNQVYDLYAQKQYAQVITRANDLLRRFPDNRSAIQLYYLKAIAGGHLEKLPPFQADLQEIATKYPADKLVTPLVNQHLAYIEANKPEVAGRLVVLTGEDPDEIPFTPPVAYKKQTEYRKAYHPSAPQPEPSHPVSAPIKGLSPAAAAIKTQQGISNLQGKLVDTHIKLPEYQLQQAAQTSQQDSSATPAKQLVTVQNITSIFSKRDSSHYYFAINVTTGTTNLASSRFGIGQFNRTRYFGYGFKHELVNAGPDDQIIYIGRFYSLADAKKYASSITPLLPDIMKVPKDKYSFFIITKENLDKLADQKTVDSYTDYYQKNY